MKNELVEPKYKIGDIILFLRGKVYTQGYISRAVQKDGGWKYNVEIAGGETVNEENVIKKL